MSTITRRRVAAFAAVTALAALAAGCGGSDDAAAPTPTPTPSPTPAPASKTGRFVDAAVSNLGYACTGAAGVADTGGVTDALGQFSYETGQTCTFSIAGITLGSASGAGVVTPVALVAGATPGTPNAQVTNIVRFLLSIDNDGDPTNGVAIAAETNAALQGRTLNFASASFDADATALLGLALPGRALVGADVAAAHLDLSLLGLFAGSYTCSYRATISGVDTVLGSVAISIADGLITGSGMPAGSSSGFEVQGSINAAGDANLSAGSTSTGATFQGSFTLDGVTGAPAGEGTWDDPDLGSGTWRCQHA